jgi:hypothetical protein
MVETHCAGKVVTGAWEKGVSGLTGVIREPAEIATVTWQQGKGSSELPLWWVFIWQTAAPAATVTAKSATKRSATPCRYRRRRQFLSIPKL